MPILSIKLEEITGEPFARKQLFVHGVIPYTDNLVSTIITGLGKELETDANGEASIELKATPDHVEGENYAIDWRDGLYYFRMPNEDASLYDILKVIHEPLPSYTDIQKHGLSLGEVFGMIGSTTHFSRNTAGDLLEILSQNVVTDIFLEDDVLYIEYINGRKTAFLMEAKKVSPTTKPTATEAITLLENAGYRTADQILEAADASGLHNIYDLRHEINRNLAYSSEIGPVVYRGDRFSTTSGNRFGFSEGGILEVSIGARHNRDLITTLHAGNTVLIGDQMTMFMTEPARQVVGSARDFVLEGEFFGENTLAFGQGYKLRFTQARPA